MKPITDRDRIYQALSSLPRATSKQLIEMTGIESKLVVSGVHNLVSIGKAFLVDHEYSTSNRKINVYSVTPKPVEPIKKQTWLSPLMQ